MNRADALALRDLYVEEKNRIIKAVMNNFDMAMGDASIEERQKTLLYGGIYTISEREKLNDLEVKINGYNHMLEEGFFKPKQPEKEKDEVLY